LFKLKQQTCNDSFQLFSDLQTLNPYTKQMRLSIGRAFDKVYKQLLPRRVNNAYLVFGIQGGKGSFNEQALMTYLKKHQIKKYRIKYLYTTEKVLRYLYEGKIDYGQFAIHNSTGGMVKESIEAIARYKFEIVEEFAIKIAHYAMKSKVVDTASVQKYLTHPQVIKQCRQTLNTKYANWIVESGEGDLIDHANVAKAIYNGKIAQNIGVLGPKILADIYNLDIVAENLQDLQQNYTSFLMVKL